MVSAKTRVRVLVQDDLVTVRSAIETRARQESRDDSIARDQKDLKIV